MSVKLEPVRRGMWVVDWKLGVGGEQGVGGMREIPPGHLTCRGHYQVIDQQIKLLAQ